MLRCASLVLTTALLVGIAPGALGQADRDAPGLPPLGFHVNGGELPNLAAAHAAGADHVVVVFSWRDIEPTPGYHYWDRTDEVLRAADYYGLEVIARLGRPPDWARDDQGPAPWRLDAYADFVGRATARYGERLAGIILWNEPNLALEWDGLTPDPAAYAALLAAAYPTAKERAPDLPVFMAGLAFTLGDGATATNDLDYLTAVYAAGGGAYFDGLAMHPYGFGRPPQETPATDRLNFRRTELQRAIMERFGDDDKPVWITEMGWRTAAPNPADGWQVVSPEDQLRYTRAALAWTAETYPWVERTTLWEINAGPDRYGYGIWHGPNATAPLYAALAAEADGQIPEPDAPRTVIPILAPDAVVRLGDIGTLHPHWVHLHAGGENFSPIWQGRFFLSNEEAARPYDLLLESMQIDQPGNRVLINGLPVGRLVPRTRPDPTSTWAQQRLTVDAGPLKPGMNTFTLISGLRNPVRQYAWWRYENLQIRDVKLVGRADSTPAAPQVGDWTALPSPPGWTEVNRLRHFPDPDGTGTVWATGNRTGQLWVGPVPPAGAPLRMINLAGAAGERTFTDAQPVGDGILAATDAGLLWQPGPATRWESVAGAPATYAYVTTSWRGQLLAGFEKQGIWRADHPAGPWRLLGLPGLTVLDLMTGPDNELIAATSYGVYRHTGAGWTRLPEVPQTAAETAEPGAHRFMTRLVRGDEDVWVVRNQDRFWRWTGQAWVNFGPETLQDELYSVIACCAAGSLVGSDRQGLWRLDEAGAWTRIVDGHFDRRKITGGLKAGAQTLVATENGLFASPDLTRWAPVSGLAPTVTDLIIDPQDATRWYAATPAGVFRSDDAGANWASISPPWVVWDLALGQNGRLFAARGSGLAWTDDAGDMPVGWKQSAGMETVTFFKVAPHPVDPQRVWAGSWGNDIGVSEDGGATLMPLRNGLETLSVLSILWHQTSGQITIGTIEGLFRSDDDGASWFKLPGPLQNQTIYALLQAEDGTIWAGAADGLWQSGDYGVTWRRMPEVPETTILNLGATTAGSASLLWAGSEGDGLWLGQNQGATWLAAGPLGESVYALTETIAGRVIATGAGLMAMPAAQPSQ